MLDILFSHSYYYPLDQKQWNNKTPYPPLGTIYAASLLRNSGFSVSLFDTNLRDNPFEIEKEIQDQKPSFLVIYDDGFNYLTKMCLTNMREAAFEMIAIGKKYNCTVIVNSSDSTDHYKKYLSKGADYVLLGEGEISLKELVFKLGNNEQIDLLKGIVYKNDLDYTINPKREVLKDLDELPMPAWDLIDINAYKDVWAKSGKNFTLNIATTRGCPYKCNWCAKPIYGVRYNSHSPEYITKLIATLKENYSVTNFWMCDDIFGLKPNWVQEFDVLLKKENLEISFKIQSRADLLLKENSIEALVNSGLKEVWIGAESGSQNILDAMDKGTTIEQIETATKLLQERGVRVAFFIQYGYLGETKVDIDKTIDLIRRAKPDDMGISISYPLPGTKFYEKVKSQLKEKQNWTDSNDLAMMFSGTFNPHFYKKLHSYTHKEFQIIRGVESLKRGLRKPISLKKGDIKTMLKTPLYWFLAKKEKFQLSNMENKNERN